VRVKLQTSSGKRIYVELKRKPLLPGRVFKNIYTKKCKEMCAKKKMFSSREEFSFGLKTVFFFLWPFWCIIHTQSHTFFPHTNTLTNSYESSGLFLGFVFHFVLFFFCFFNIFRNSVTFSHTNYKEFFRVRAWKMHVRNISSTCQQIIIIIWL